MKINVTDLFGADVEKEIIEDSYKIGIDSTLVTQHDAITILILRHFLRRIERLERDQSKSYDQWCKEN